MTCVQTWGPEAALGTIGMQRGDDVWRRGDEVWRRRDDAWRRGDDAWQSGEEDEAERPRVET